MMMIFGVFVFSLPTATYQKLQRNTSWRHASSSRVGDMPDYQFVGRGDDVITLDGSILPEFMGTPLSLTALRVMGDTGKAYPLISGTGKIFGLYFLEDLEETQTYFFKNGAARKIEFKLTLKQKMKAGTLVNNVISTVMG
ncbi:MULTISPECIES: phage tail protein [unclassified Acinetobacter]|uniref:phage tail protein n=1 Tax=unclassified Acinetobacter TaxID=196816 RepID=UPI00190AC60F|nr:MULTISPECIES: phage tail protein [unclassified Acinetobacter]MBK0062610.1 phage tail protein [Acinetobacter sp. S55]MBK0065813.1 phage tail protein [Acinetobacter sp. S54]